MSVALVPRAKVHNIRKGSIDTKAKENNYLYNLETIQSTHARPRVFVKLFQEILVPVQPLIYIVIISPTQPCLYPESRDLQCVRGPLGYPP